MSLEATKWWEIRDSNIWWPCDVNKLLDFSQFPFPIKWVVLGIRGSNSAGNRGRNRQLRPPTSPEPRAATGTTVRGASVKRTGGPAPAQLSPTGPLPPTPRGPHARAEAGATPGSPDRQPLPGLAPQREAAWERRRVERAAENKEEVAVENKRNCPQCARTRGGAGVKRDPTCTQFPPGSRPACGRERTQGGFCQKCVFCRGAHIRRDRHSSPTPTPCPQACTCAEHSQKHISQSAPGAREPIGGRISEGPRLPEVSESRLCWSDWQPQQPIAAFRRRGHAPFAGTEPLLSLVSREQRRQVESSYSGRPAAHGDGTSRGCADPKTLPPFISLSPFFHVYSKYFPSA
ncbi:uncharacterized protein LOC750221 [Pan troglodytes]|uniref:uncharacterized protein LOC750221 n=1 Tax=Pan troglodytes TaxID=9598 RepID=UPI0007DBDC1D|nr:uncharacterized protein LOC750221 [Pan troglodytes]